MADAQKDSLSQGDGGGGPDSKQINSLQDRFAALSHFASLTPTNKKGKSGNAAADPQNPLNHLKDTIMGRHEQEGFESRLDHHSPPQDGIDIARKRQAGLQDPVLESVCLPSVKCSGSHKLNPLASPFDVMPIKTKDHSTPGIHTSTLEPIHTSRHQRSKGDIASASVISGRFSLSEVVEAIEAVKEEDKSSTKNPVDEGKLAKNAIEIEVADKIPYIKTENMGDGQFASGAEEPEEIQLEDNHIKHEPLIEEAGTLSLETTTGITVANPTPANRVAKFDSPGSNKLPGAVLSRYPRMAKYLTTLVAQEGSTRLAVSGTSIPLVATILQQKPISEDGKTTIKKEKPASFVLQPRSISTPTSDKETELCPNGQVSSMPQKFSPETGNIMPSCVPKAPIFEANFASRIEKSHGVSVQKNTVEPREMSPTVNLEKSTEVTLLGRELKETDISPFQERKLEQPPSTRPTLPERYAIPVRDQNSEATALKASSGAGGGGRGDGRGSQQMRQDPLMEQLALIDKRFSRDSGGIFARHDSSLSRRSSMSSDASLTFSITPDNLAVSAQASKCVDQTKIEDSDRFRRSMGPSPSPRRGQEVGFPEATAGNMGPINFGHSGKAEKQAADQKNMAGNWLDQFSNSAKNENPLPRGQPSVLARMHVDICDDEGDSDGVAPGEWIKPVELLKKGSTKAKADSIIQFGLPSLPDASGPLSESVKGSATGSARHTQRPKGPGQPKYPHPKPSHAKTLQDSTSVDRSIPGAMEPRGRVGSVGAGANKKAKKKDIVTMGWREEGITEMEKLDEKAREDLRRPFVEDDWQRKGESEQETIKWRAPREGGLFASPPSSIHGASTLLPQNKIRIVSGRSSGRGSGRGSGSMLSHPKGTLKVGVVNNIVPDTNDSTARISQSITGQIPSVSGARTPMAPPHLHTQTVPPAPSVTSGMIAQVKQPLVAAYVRKLCPLFFTGRCHQGQNCLDLHPNYDKQSGIHEDKRFATKEAFNEEELVYAKMVKDRGKALEDLVRESRDDVGKKYYGTQLGVNIKPGRPRPMTLQVGSVTIGRNARGETEWTVEPPKKPEHVEEEPMSEPEHTKPKKQGKRRIQA